MGKDNGQITKIAKLHKRPIRKHNHELRSREYLTSGEVTGIRKAAS